MKWTATLVAVLVAGCAAVPAPPPESPPPQPVAQFPGYPFVRDRERDRAERAQHRVMGDRESGPISAEYNLMIEADENGPPSAAQLLRAHEQRQALVREPQSVEKSAGLQPSQWQALGPSNVGGRVRALAFDPRSASRLLAGTASGGLWITEDAGATWRANQDFLPNLSITSIVFDPRNPNTVYLGTGEASGGLVGIGMFRSADAGRTWSFLASTSPDSNLDWRFVNRIAVHPTQTEVLLAAVTNDTRTMGGIYRSTDAGASWTKVFASKALDIAFDPNNPTRALAGLDDGMLAYSTDAGVSWSRTASLVTGTPTGRNGTARAEIAFARNATGVVYTSIDNLKGQVWRSDDSGASWRQLGTPQHLNNQGDYDNAIWVDPTDSNHVVVAGLDIYQSRDGGNTFTKLSDWSRYLQSPHADHHQLVSPPNFGPANPLLYDSGDGGIYVAPNIYSATLTNWTNLNNGLAVTQFYAGAGRTAAGGRIIGGAQDNYSLQLSNGAWRRWASGDGGFVAVDPVSDLVMYGEYVYAAVHRSMNGNTSSYICTGITEAINDEDDSPACGTGNTQKANFIAPILLDPNSRDRLYVGAASLWVTDNPRSSSVSWRTVKDPSSVGANFINAIAVAEGDANTVWVGYNNGEVHRTANAGSFAPTWTRVGQGVLPGRLVLRITVDRDNRDHVIVAFTGFTANNVWQTFDGGTTWSSMTANLPQAPVFDVKRHPRKANWLYAATSVGIYTSEDAGATWSTTNEGPANVRVRELFWIDDTTLGAATYGRGMFKVTVAAGGPDNYQDLWWSGTSENGWGISITQHRDVLFSELFIYDDQGRPLWVVMPGGTWDASFTRFSGPVYIPRGSYFAAYDVSRHSVGAQVGTVTLDFANRGSATMSYTINGLSGSKSISRISFGPQESTPVASYGDLWWGGTAQNGWGVTINQQYRTLFSIWYTYDRDGQPTWFVMPAGTWTAANTYTATAYRASGPRWIGVPYDASRHSLSAVGTVTFTFTDAQNAVMGYTIEGVSGTNALARVPF